jgi:phenylalanyl-tRNA synthetase beta chain
MRIPLSWLKEFIPISISSEELARILTMAGLEVDHWETTGELLKEIIVGKVLESVKHPNADKLSVATVTDGSEIYQVVCGAPNCRPGLKTPFARIGVKVGSGKEAFTIKKSKIRGVESYGMLCATSEIGLAGSDEGIMELPDHLPEGEPLSEFFSDTYFDISLTPNLSHCNSIFGVARELAVFLDGKLTTPEVSFRESDARIEDSVHVSVDDKVDCSRYACRVIKDVTVGPSPDWLKNRLEKCGLRSVNNVVDATNYVLLEMGHPLHAFDLDQLADQEIVVRKAGDGESIHTLDSKDRVLAESMLLICDREKPVAVAGVMGGLDSEIRDRTRHIVLESAYFDSVSIRRTSKQLGLQTDASKRFERGTDPNQILASLDRAAMVIQQVAGGEIQAGFIDILSKEFPDSIIPCRLSRINQILGIALSRGEAEDVFRRLQFPFQWDGQDVFQVHVPTYRNDINVEIDLVEEVARVYGYDNIPRICSAYQPSSLPPPAIYLFENHIRQMLIGEGLQEFLTCDLIGPSILDVIHQQMAPKETFIKVLNPNSIEHSILRTSLLPGLLQVVKYNFDHQNHRIAGFEIGKVHLKEGDQYEEQTVAAIILSGASIPPQWDQKENNVDFFDLKGIAENLFESLGILQPVYKNIGLETFHPGRQASLFVDSLEVGSIGEIHPSIQRRLDVPQRLLFAEFNLSSMQRFEQPLTKVKPLAIYPCSERDWTFTVNESVPFSYVLEKLNKQKSSILESVTLKGIYRSEKIPEGCQNMTLHFVYRDPTKTIEQESVETEHQRLTSAVLKAL